MLPGDTQKHWFVMRDFKKFNAKAPAYKELPKLGIRCFTPMHWVVATGSNGKRQRYHRPVIQNLLFVYESREILDPIVEKAEKLQYQFIRGAGQGAVMTVPDADMERFIHAVESDGSPIYYTPEELTPDMIGKDIVVTGGPLDGYQGKLLKMRGSKKRRLIVSLKNYMVAAVEVSPDFVQLLSSGKAEAE